MKLYHATPKSNTESIRVHGLDPQFSKGKRQVVWLHTKSKREWAILHTMKRHGIGADEIIIIEVDVPRAHLTRRWRGLWTCDCVIREYGELVVASTLADSPIAED